MTGDRIGQNTDIKVGIDGVIKQLSDDKRRLLVNFHIVEKVFYHILYLVSDRL